MDVNKNLKLIVFDFDGTLFNLDVDWAALREKLGITGSDKSIGALMQEYRLQKHPDLEHVTAAELAAVEGKQLSDEVLTSLHGLQSTCHIAVLTRNTRYAVEAVLKGTTLEGQLFVVGREDVERLKPHPEGLAIILSHFKTQPPQAAALVGDTFHDVQAAKNAGIQSIIINNPRLAYAPEGADRYIESLSELLKS